MNPVPAPGVPPCAHDAAGAPPVYGAPQQTLYCESAPLGTVAVYHDSMGIELLFQLAEYFRKSRWSSTRTWNPGEISALKPALVLEEVVERNLPLLADVSFLGVSQVAAAAGPARGWKTGQPFQAGEQAKPAQWCALDEVNAARSPRDYDLPAKGDINAQGWAGNGDDGSVPGQVWMVITDGEKAFHARVDMGQSRPDVAAAIGKPSLATAGYRLDGSLEGIPPGSYRVALVWARPDGWMSCDSRRILNVGAEKR